MENETGSQSDAPEAEEAPAKKNPWDWTKAKSRELGEAHWKVASVLLTIFMAAVAYVVAKFAMSLDAEAAEINQIAAGLTGLGLLALFGSDMFSWWQPKDKETDRLWATVGHCLVIFGAALFIGAYFPG